MPVIPTRPLLQLMVLAGTFWLLGHPLARGAGEVDYIAGLRERGLYRLAEVYAQRQLDRGGLTDRERAELAIELSRVHNQHGLELPLQERSAVWARAEEVLDNYREGSGQPAYTLLVDLQQPLNLLAQARLERLEHLDQSGEAIEPVRGKLREAIRSLRQLGSDIEEGRRQLALGRAPQESPYTLEELDGLARHVQLSLAQALREQGLTYPPRSADRDDALLQAADTLRRLATDRVVNLITWQARVALVDTLADLGRSDEGLPLWSQWSAADAPPQVAPQLFAAGVRLLLANSNLEEASRQLARSAWPPGKSAEVDYVRLEIAIAQVEQGGADLAPVERQLALLRDYHPPQWIRRGETLVGRVLAARGDTSTAIGLKHAAEHFYRAGKLDEAVAAYDKVAELARQSQDRDEAFAAERTAAAIVQQLERYDEAAARFRRLALASLDKPESPRAHREALLSLAAATRSAPVAERSEKLAQYVQACHEHLSHWPDGPTSDEVRFWLGSLLVERQQWPAAIEVLVPIPTSSAYSGRAAVGLAKAYRRRLEETSDAQARTSLVQQATARLQPTIVEGGAWPASWTPEQRETALELARVQLAGGESGASYAEKILTQAIVAPPAPDQGWQSRAVPVLAMALVQGGKPSEGVEWLRRGAGDAESLETLVDQLVVRLAQLPPGDPQRQALGQLVLAALDVAGEGTKEWKSPPRRYHAAGLAAIGEERQARELYEGLVKEFPQRGDLWEELAGLLAESTTAEDRQRALELWQQVEAGSQRGGERWFRARVARVKLLLALGQRSEAKKLLELTRLLYPELGGSSTQREFEALSLQLATE